VKIFWFLTVKAIPAHEHDGHRFRVPVSYAFKVGNNYLIQQSLFSAALLHNAGVSLRKSTYCLSERFSLKKEG